MTREEWRQQDAQILEWKRRMVNDGHPWFTPAPNAIDYDPTRDRHWIWRGELKRKLTP